jgi:hypothetical protein
MDPFVKKTKKQKTFNYTCTSFFAIATDSPLACGAQPARIYYLPQGKSCVF